MANYTAPKISELTQDLRTSMTRAVGLPGLPYFMAYLEKGDDDRMEYEVGGIESASVPLTLFSPHMTPEQVTRELFCNMPTPNMMTILRDLIDITKPDSKSHLMTIFGDPSTGKSFMFKQVGKLVHPQGAIMVDCGGMNVRELFWRTIIDYGTGVKEQLDARFANGTVSQQSIETLKEAFPEAIIEKDGKTSINWEGIGARRVDAEGKAEEGRDAAVARAVSVLENLYKIEGIDAKANAFGIKTVPGEIIESFRTGRPLVLDEFTKCKIGSDDTMQTFLEFVRGDKPEWSTVNPMATNADDDSSRNITLRQSDVRMGWFLGISGNEAKDGHTTHQLSDSMMSRLNPRYIGEMTQMDWAHRISQMLVGFPVTTFYRALDTHAKSHPEEFGKLMNDICTLGLTTTEMKLRPPHQEFYLRNFASTVTAVDEKLAPYYYTRQELANTESKIYVRDRDKWEKISDEIMSGGEQKMRVTPRLFMDHLDAALRPRPEVRAREKLTLEFDLSKVFNSFDPATLGNSSPAWYNLGKALSTVITEGVVNDTIAMPMTRAALISFCDRSGISKLELKEAQPSDLTEHLSGLLKYDPMKDKGFGDTEELRAVADVLMGVISSVHPNIKVGAEILPLENIGRALQAVNSDMENGARAVALPNDDLDTAAATPILSGKSVTATIGEKMQDTDAKLVDFRTALASLALPAYRDANLDRMWPTGIEDLIDAEQLELESIKILRGVSTNKFDIAAIEVESHDAPVYLYIIRDGFTNKAVVLGPETIPVQLQSMLSKNDIAYINKNDKATVPVKNDNGEMKQVLQSVVKLDDFFTAGIDARLDQNLIDRSKTENLCADVVGAMASLHNRENIDIYHGMTPGQGIIQNEDPPVLFSRITKPRAGL